MQYILVSNSWNLIDSKGKGPLARCYHVAWYDSNIFSWMINIYLDPHLFIYGGKQSDKG